MCIASAVLAAPAAAASPSVSWRASNDAKAVAAIEKLIGQTDPLDGRTAGRRRLAAASAFRSAATRAAISPRTRPWSSPAAAPRRRCLPGHENRRRTAAARPASRCALGWTTTMLRTCPPSCCVRCRSRLSHTKFTWFEGQVRPASRICASAAIVYRSFTAISYFSV